MYKHILIPTDGSKLSAKAVKAAIEFARQARARVTAFTAVPQYPIPSEIELMNKRAISLHDYQRKAKASAKKTLRAVAARARAAGKHGCDLIFMASHGRRGISALIHGSQTRDVLTHSTIPTLVYR